MKRANRFTLAFVVFCFAIATSVLSVTSHIGDFKHEVHVIPGEDASIALNEDFDEDEIVSYGATSLDYNTTVVSHANTDIYVFVELDVPWLGTDNPMLTPAEGSDWVLYNVDTVDIDNVNYKRFIFAYSDGSTMTALEANAETSSVLSGMSIASMTEGQYGDLASKPFHVVARSVVAKASDGNIDTVWTQVPKGY